MRQHRQISKALFGNLRLGRHKIDSTPFSVYEQQIREQLQALLGEHGFDQETDIQAVTVNRIPHGHAYNYLALEDPEWPRGEAPTNWAASANTGRLSLSAFGCRVAGDTGVHHDARLPVVPRTGPMHQATVVPHHHITSGPAMVVHAGLVTDGEFHQPVE